MAGLGGHVTKSRMADIGKNEGGANNDGVEINTGGESGSEPMYFGGVVVVTVLEARALVAMDKGKKGAAGTSGTAKDWEIPFLGSVYIFVI